MSYTRRNRRSRPGLFALTGLVVAACQDVPTTAVEVNDGRRRVAERLVGRPEKDRHAALCYISRRVEGLDRYRYAILRLKFPPHVLAPDGSTRLFRFRVQQGAGNPVFAGTCRIPDTPAAVEFVEKRLRLDAHLPRGPRDDGQVTVQGCVEAGFCPLDGLVVVAPGSGYQGGWYYYQGGYNASHGDGYEPTGGGDTWDPGPDGTYRPECERDARGQCINRELAANEWLEIGRIIDRMKPNNDACAGAKAALKSLFDQGMAAFRVWDGIDYEPGGQRFGENRYDQNGTFMYIELDSYWLMNDPSLLVHEGLHKYFRSLPVDNSGTLGMSGESYAMMYEDTCW